MPNSVQYNIFMIFFILQGKRLEVVTVKKCCDKNDNFYKNGIVLNCNEKSTRKGRKNKHANEDTKERFL